MREHRARVTGERVTQQHAGPAAVVVDQHGFGEALHDLDSAASAAGVRVRRAPAAVIDDLDQNCSWLGPEEHLDDALVSGCAVGVVDDVRRGLVDGQHQVRPSNSQDLWMKIF
jgi:hypothetical protein